MAVIELTANNTALKITAGSIGFGFNPELNVVINTALFDTPIAEGDTVIYRVNPAVIKFKGIVRVIERDLVSETAQVICYAAESALEAKEWTPTHTAYNKDVLCRHNLLNATIADVIEAEFTNNDTGPQTWFSSIEAPAGVLALIAGPTDTYQVSFLSLIESVISIHPHVRWLIEYDTTSTALLPVGKLVLVDTKVGRTAHVLTIGNGTVQSCKVREDYSTVAETLHVYGAGDFVEVEEVLVPAWDVADEAIAKTLYATAPLLTDYENALASSQGLITNLQWGYDLTSVPRIFVNLTGVEEELFANKEYTLDPVRGGILWNTFTGYIDATGSITNTPRAGARALAATNPAFYGKVLRITFNYCGPDCYRLYAVSEPIANYRLRLSQVPDPDNIGQTIQKPTEQDVTVEAFKPRTSADKSDPRYTTEAGYAIAKVFTPTDDTITWDERQPEFTTAKGYSYPLGSPEFQEGRRCVRFEDRQLDSMWLAFSDLDAISNEYPFWYTWRIKIRYTAWRNLLETRTSTYGVGYTGRFVFSDLMKYTASTGASTATATATISGGAVTSGTVVNAGLGYAVAPLVKVVGDGSGATAHSTIDGFGRVASIVIDSGGTGYTSAVLSINDSTGVIVNDTSKLVTTADDVLAYYGGAQWTGEIVVMTTMHTTVGPDRKVSALPYAVGDKVTLAGSVDTALAASFVGIINDIAIAPLETGLCVLSIGTRMPQRNPFEPKPPVFVDAAANGTLVLDVSGLQRRSV